MSCSDPAAAGRGCMSSSMQGGSTTPPNLIQGGSTPLTCYMMSLPAELPATNDETNDHLQFFPLSLRDICLLNIIPCVDQYPVEHLSLLPVAIRRRLYLGLSDADILHYADTVLFTGVDTADTDCVPLQVRIDRARTGLLNGVLHDDKICLTVLVTSNISASLFLFDHLSLSKSAAISFWEHVIDLYSSSCTSVSREEVESKLRLAAILIPNRLLKYFTLTNEADISINILMVEQLLAYCNMQTPKSVTICCSRFAKSILWNEKVAVADPLKARNSLDPFFTSFLSTVETLSVVHGSIGKLQFAEKNKIKLIALAVINSVILRKKPSLIKLELHFQTKTIMEILERLTPRLLAHHQPSYSSSASCFSNHPFLLESLSLRVPNAEEIESFAACKISSLLLLTITAQLSNLCELTIAGVGYNCTCKGRIQKEFSLEHRHLLSTVLTDFLKQPQFRSLSMVDAPCFEACILIQTFLHTPASHKQTLSIKFAENTESNIQMPPVIADQVLPDSNTHFKYLEISNPLSHVLSSWLVSLPELKLHKLSLTGINFNISKSFAQQLQLVHIKHVVTENCLYGSTDANSLDKLLIIANPALKQLELKSPNEESDFPALNHCLSELYLQGRRLDELRLHHVIFDGDHAKELLTLVRDLSQCSGTVLVLSPNGKYQRTHEPASTSADPEKLLLETLSEEFQDKKIKGIISCIDTCGAENDPSESLRLIADEVIVKSESY